MISETEWDEILALSSKKYRESRMVTDGFGNVAWAVAHTAKSFAKTDLTEDKIIDLFCMVQDSSTPLWTGLIERR